MLMLIVILVVAFIINTIYHKVFHVTYFGFMPLIFEWFICLVIAAMIVGSFFA